MFFTPSRPAANKVAKTGMGWQMGQHYAIQHEWTCRVILGYGSAVNGFSAPCDVYWCFVARYQTFVRVNDWVADSCVSARMFDQTSDELIAVALN